MPVNTPAHAHSFPLLRHDHAHDSCTCQWLGTDGCDFDPGSGKVQIVGIGLAGASGRVRRARPSTDAHDPSQKSGRQNRHPPGPKAGLQHSIMKYTLMSTQSCAWKFPIVIAVSQRKHRGR